MLNHLGSKLFGSLKDVPLSAVAEEHDQGEGIIVCCHRHAVVDCSIKFISKALTVSDDHKADTVSVELLHLCGHCLDHQAHKSCHLILGTIPVLFRKRIDGQILHACLNSRLNACAYAFHTFKMAKDSFLSSLFGPTSIAVHDHRNMDRYIGHSFTRHICLLDISYIFAPIQLVCKGIDKIGIVKSDTFQRKLCHRYPDFNILIHTASSVVCRKLEGSVPRMHLH